MNLFQNTAFLTTEIVSDYYNEIIEKYGNVGLMEPEPFKEPSQKIIV